MHVHIPKPIHGWREFFGEVGIIVLGILIALGLEQLVETVHWRHRAEQATEDFHVAIGNVGLQAAEQQVAGPCIDRQLALLEARLTEPGAYRPVTLYDDGLPFTVRAPSRSWTDNVWRTVTGEGVATHLPAKQREQIGEVFQMVQEMQVRAQQSDVILWRLRSLAQPLTLDAATRLSMVQDIEELRGRQALMTLIVGQLGRQVRETGMMPPAAEIRTYLDESGTIAFCRTHRLPLGNMRAID